MKKLTVLKIGGNVIDNEAKLEQVLADFATIKEAKVLIHGGGKIADNLCTELGIVPQKIEGRRITDEATLRVVTMVYAGLINKNIVAQLQKNGVNAIGLSGADLNSIQAHKRQKGSIDYGFAGDIDFVNGEMLKKLIKIGATPVFSAITHDKNGQLLNTNADTIATQLAIALSAFFEVTLKFCFEKDGVLADPKDDASVISFINAALYQQLKSDAIITDGMIPKMDNAFDAIAKGVNQVVICGTNAIAAHSKNKGTTIKSI